MSGYGATWMEGVREGRKEGKQEVIARIRAWTKQHLTGNDLALLEAYANGELDASDGGNFDDALEKGISLGHALAAEDLEGVLDGLEAP